MIKELTKYLVEHPDIYIFLSLITTVAFFYFFIGRVITGSRMHHDQRRRFMVNLRMLFIFIIISAVFILWANELYQFVISLAALLAACAIAGKEVFLCYGGSFYKAFARPFSIGDRIQVGDIRGDVVDIGLMSTQLLEVGPKDYTHQLTGRTITIPNSLFLNSSVFNETDSVSEGRGFVLHVFKVPIKNDPFWEHKKKLLEESAHEACAKYIDQSIIFFEKMAKKRQVGVPLVRPRINIKFESADLIMLMVRVSIPTEKKGIIEQAILNSYLQKANPQSGHSE